MNPKPLFTIGQHVYRVESRDTTHSAIVIAISNYDALNGYSYELAYDEGGNGFWPESSLTAIQ